MAAGIRGLRLFRIYIIPIQIGTAPILLIENIGNKDSIFLIKVHCHHIRIKSAESISNSFLISFPVDSQAIRFEDVE